MNLNIPELLKQLRKTSGLSANEVVEKLKDYNIEISGKTLYGYESGVSKLNADAFIALCMIYKCENPLELFGLHSTDPMDYRLIEKYRDLDPHGQDMVDTVLDKEHSRCIAAQEQAKATVSALHDRNADYLLPNAAHERTDIEVTDEDRLADDEIMRNF
ncbi:MAG: helix-turn-helix transcriptional regulator [Eubacteriales bacterium]|nr:helix-turn-helix transcriptional regulator [Eubacteriales bacterium]